MGHSYYKEGTNWEKGHLYALMGHLSRHIWALIVTAEPWNCPCEPVSLPDGAQSRAVESGGRGAWTPNISNTQKVPLFSKGKVPFFLSK